VVLWNLHAKGKLLQRLETVVVRQRPGTSHWHSGLDYSGHDLLIGNRFGGTIAAFDCEREFVGNLLDGTTQPMRSTGCGDSEFDKSRHYEAGDDGNSSRVLLFFAAGIDNYAARSVRDFHAVAAS